jgi:hypothetical protein
MPDDLVDLDAAFAALERDITNISRAPGATWTFAAARRRRRMEIGAVVAAVAVIAVAGVAAGNVLARNDNSVSPTDGLPDPVPIDAAALTDATTGWTPAWADTGASKEELVTARVQTDCLGQVVGAATPEPSMSGEQGLLAGQAVAFINVADFGQDDVSAQAAWQAYSHAAASCAGARQTADYTSGSAQVTRYAITPGQPRAAQYIWLVRVNDQIGVAWIGNAAAPMPDNVGDQVTDAMLAGVLSPGSYTESAGEKTASPAEPSAPAKP